MSEAAASALITNARNWGKHERGSDELYVSVCRSMILRNFVFSDLSCFRESIIGFYAVWILTSGSPA
jgi:hypothetical protein